MKLVWGGMCVNQIIEEIESPDKEHKAVIFIRDCGATTGYSTQVSIIETTDDLDDRKGNILIMSDKTGNGLTFDNGGAKIIAMWTENDVLTIFVDKRSEIRKQKNSYWGTTISYKHLSN